MTVSAMLSFKKTRQRTGWGWRHDCTVSVLATKRLLFNGSPDIVVLEKQNDEREDDENHCKSLISIASSANNDDVDDDVVRVGSRRLE